MESLTSNNYDDYNRECEKLMRDYDAVRAIETARQARTKCKPQERDLEACAEDAVNYVKKCRHLDFVEGKQALFIYAFAYEMNRYRVLLDDTTDWLIDNYAGMGPGSFGEFEIQRACVAAYKEHAKEYGKKSPWHLRQQMNSTKASKEAKAVGSEASDSTAGSGDKRRRVLTSEELYAALDGLCELRYNIIRETLEVRPTAKLLRKDEVRFAAELELAKQGRVNLLPDEYDTEGWCIMTDRHFHSIFRFLRHEDPYLKEADLRSLLTSGLTPDYDPMLEYFRGLPEWDGVDRVSWLFDYLPLKYDSKKKHEQFRELFHKFLLGSVRCALGGPYNELVLVLNGGESAGKTRFSRLLTPPALKRYGRDLQRNELSTKDGRIAMGSNFHIRLDEIQGMTQQEFHVFNAAATMAHISERHAYARNVSSQRRRCTFITTTNKPDFVRTPNGSRRCLILTFEENANIEYLKNNFDVDQLYAQLYKEAQTDAPQYPTSEEVKLVTAHNFSICTIRERDFLPRFYREVRMGEAGEWHTSAEIMEDISPRFGNVRLNLEMLEEVLSRSGFVRKFSPRGWAYYIKKKTGAEREADKGWNPYNQ
jgi:hypothetical protein